MPSAADTAKRALVKVLKAAPSTACFTKLAPASYVGDARLGVWPTEFLARGSSAKVAQGKFSFLQ